MGEAANNPHPLYNIAYRASLTKFLEITRVLDTMVILQYCQVHYKVVVFLEDSNLLQFEK